MRLTKHARTTGYTRKNNADSEISRFEVNKPNEYMKN